MTIVGWLQIAAVLGAVLIAARPLGLYMARVFQGERTLLSPVVGPIERGLFAMAGVKPAKEQNWLSYALAMLAFNATGFLLLYGLMRLQAFLPFNPQGFAGVAPDLAFNTAVSFVTNTNWQAYGGETTMRSCPARGHGCPAGRSSRRRVLVRDSWQPSARQRRR